MRYDEFAPTLLIEVQHQQIRIAAQAESIEVHGAQLRAVQQQLVALKDLSQATQLALQKLLANDEVIAQR